MDILCNFFFFPKIWHWNLTLSWSTSAARKYSGNWILRPLRSKTTCSCLIRPLLNAPMGFTSILTCVERPSVIPNPRPPLFGQNDLAVLKDHYPNYWFSHKCHVIYRSNVELYRFMSFIVVYIRDTGSRKSYHLPCCLPPITGGESKNNNPVLRDHLQYKTPLCRPKGWSYNPGNTVLEVLIYGYANSIKFMKQIDT